MSSDFSSEYFKPCVKKFVSTVLLVDDQLEYREPENVPKDGVASLIVPEQGSARTNFEDQTTDSFSDKEESNRKVYIADLIKSFSKEELLVTPINPEKLKMPNKDLCIDLLYKLAAKSDVIILDWDMTVSFLDDEKITSEELSKELIQKLNDDKKYRLVIIYTADKESDVKKNLPTTSTIGIKIYGKSGTTGTIVKEYEELATQVNNDYLEGKEGLLGSALLTSLSALRETTYSMLNTLNTDYDEALMYHRVLLSEPNKIKDFCQEIINDEILAHIEDASIDSFFTKEAFLRFINNYNIEINAKKTKDSLECKISDEELDKLLDKGYKSFFDKEVQGLISKGENLDFLISATKENLMKSFSYYSTMLPGDIKSNLKLGCIVKDENDYFLCIQPPCDSERIEKLDDSGKCKKPQSFLFLKLKKRDDSVSFYVKENTSYYGVWIQYKSVATFLFAGDSNGFVSQDHDGFFKTYSFEGDSINLKYICCLRPMFAQKIANNFAANISRVGIDQFEWLRLKGRE